MMEVKNPEGQIVGRIDKVEGVGTCYFTSRRPEHFMVKFRGFGISQSILDTLILEGVKSVFIAYNGKNGVQTFRSRLDQWLNTTKVWVDKETDTQKFLSIDEMELVG